MNGINTIPRTYRGEGLAYISPEEAIWLRQMGGGIPQDRTGQLDPTRQITGPAGIPRFPGPSAAYGGGAATAAGGVSPGSTGPGQGGGHGHSSQGNITTADVNAYMNAQLKADIQKQNQRGGGPNSLTSVQPVVAPAVQEVVDEEGRRLPTEEEIAERAAKLDARLQAGADRLQSMYAALGYGPVGPRYGETSSGEEFFPGSTSVPISEIPAWRGLAAGPAGPSIEAGLNTNVTGQTPVNLLERVAAIADQIGLDQGTRTAAHGGLVGRYDLGGLVDSMMLQASRSRENIPSNMVL